MQTVTSKILTILKERSTLSDKRFVFRFEIVNSVILLFLDQGFPGRGTRFIGDRQRRLMWYSTSKQNSL